MQNKNQSVRNKIQGNAQKADILAICYSIYCTGTYPTYRKRAVAHNCSCSLLTKFSYGPSWMMSSLSGPSAAPGASITS